MDRRSVSHKGGINLDKFMTRKIESDSFPCLSPKDESCGRNSYRLIKTDPNMCIRPIGGSGMRSYYFYKSSVGTIYVISEYVGALIEWRQLNENGWYQVL